MLTPGWAALSRLAATVSLIVLALVPAAAGQQPDAASQAVTPEHRKQIEAAKSVEELTGLGKQFLVANKEAAARLCVERICTLDPKLLTDPQVQTSSRQWNDLWFTCRAEIQARKLAANDAAGRLELARWLKQGGVFGPARALVTEAMRIDPRLPGARQLLADLEPPLGLDFRFALTKPVLLTEYQDAGVQVEAGRGSLLLLAPVRYRAIEVRFWLIPSAIKVTTDLGKPARVLGLLLTEEPPKSDTKSTGALGVAAPLKTTPTTPSPASDQPPDNFTNTFYERLQVELKAGVPTLIWQNTVVSRAVGSGDRATGGSSGTGSPRAAGGSRGTGGTGYTAGPGARESLTDKRGEMPANGWMGLLVKFPEEAAKLTVELPETGPETIDLTLLKLVQQQQTQGGQPQPPTAQDLVKSMLRFASDPAAPTAQLALAWLAGNLSPSAPTPGVPQAGQSAEIEIIQAMLKGVGHPDRRVRRTAFDGLLKCPSQLPEDALDWLREKAPENLIMSLLGEVEAALSAAASARSGTGMPVLSGAAAGDLPPALQKVLESMPASETPANAFLILGACLNSKHPQAREEALRILLADGTRQSLQILADLSSDANKTLAGQIAGLKSGEMKAAILRLRLVKPDNRTVTAMLAGCGDLSVTVTSEDDPLLIALRNPDLQAPAKKALLDLLARSDLSAVADSQTFGDILKTLLDESGREKKKDDIRPALLSMVASQFKPQYQSPIPRGSEPGKPTGEPQAGGFESLLAQLAMDPDMNDEAGAAKAALALVASGRVNGLKEEFLKADNPKRCLQMIAALGRARELRSRDALPFFLASTLAHSDQEVLKQALSLLAIIHDECDKDNRWRVNLAVRQGVDQDQLVKLTAHQESDVARQATVLLKRIIAMTSREAEDFDRSTSENARLDCVRERILAERVNAPAGQFACLVLVDVEAAGPAEVAAPGTGQPGVFKRANVPLASSRVTITRSGEGRIRITADGVDIGRVEGSAEGEAPGAASGGTLPIDAAELISAALKSEDARKEGLAGKVNITATREAIREAAKQHRCELKPEPLGGWSAEITIGAPKTSDRPMRVTAAKIILQPLMP